MSSTERRRSSEGVAWQQNGNHDNTVPGLINRVILNKGTEEELECYAYQDSLCLKVLFWLLVVLSLGVLLLVMHWKPEWRLAMTKRMCSMRHADTILVKPVGGDIAVVPVTVRHLDDSRVNSYYACSSSQTARKIGADGEYSYIECDAPSSASDTAEDTSILATKSKVYLKYFDYHQVRYIWDQSIQAFRRLHGLDDGVYISSILDKYHGLTEDQQAYRIYLYGENNIDVQVKSYFRLFFQEVVNPFYIFQICSVILWSLDDYYIYASCIVLISAISLGVELYETRKQSVTLRDMVAAAETTITVIRYDASQMEVPTSHLVPGDVIVVPTHGCMMTCDAVLVSGNAIVNESMLTGESVPVTKTPLGQSETDEIFSPDSHKRHTLFCGTQVIQTRYYGDATVRAVVVRTGYSTAKGELVRSILYPKPMGFKFYRDAMRFIGFLACIAALGMIYSIVMLIRNGEKPSEVVLRALDIITIVVPPALPAAMTIGTAYAQNRLKKAGIFCISPARINMCGKLKLVCFDKTGTLTEDGLDMWGVVPVEDHKFQPPLRDPSDLPAKGPMAVGMATCHSLTIIEGELRGDPLDLKMFDSINWIIEEPGRDTSKFDNLMPTVVKPISREAYYIDDDAKQAPFEVGIVRQFPFSSGLQRMSVIVRVLSATHMDIYCKGAPEKIASLCKAESLPGNLYDILQKYTAKGYRVIAVAWRSLESKLTWHQAQRVTRETVEKDLEFLGLVVMENMLKPQTTPVIRQLGAANIRTVMVTGDNILTAISVARQCSMVEKHHRMVLINARPPEGGRPACIEWEEACVDAEETTGELLPGAATPSSPDSPTHVSVMDTSVNTSPGHMYQIDSPHTVAVDLPDQMKKFHFAVTGRSFSILRHHFPDLLDKVFVRGTVFARMSPDQKTQLVESLQDLGYGVGMCGDGANDCGALRAAHAGISLSEAEASVASPFTSRVANIECVPTVIREGRAALVTSFGLFKYMALYSIIQFVSVLILYTMKTNFGDWMFLYIDLVITTTVAFLMGHTAAYPRLVAQRPPGSLVGPVNLCSIIIHIIIVCCFQISAFFYLTQQPWYDPPVQGTDTNDPKRSETTVVFCLSSFQYLMLAFVFSKGPPFRKPLWTNVLFTVALIILAAICSLLLLHPFPFLMDILQLKDLPDMRFRLTILGLVCINFFLAFLFESLIIPSDLFHKLSGKLKRKKVPKNPYKSVECELDNEPYWPPVGTITMATGPRYPATQVQIN